MFYKVGLHYARPYNILKLLRFVLKLFEKRCKHVSLSPYQRSLCLRANYSMQQGFQKCALLQMQSGTINNQMRLTVQNSGKDFGQFIIRKYANRSLESQVSAVRVNPDFALTDPGSTAI